MPVQRKDSEESIVKPKTSRVRKVAPKASVAESVSAPATVPIATRNVKRISTPVFLGSILVLGIIVITGAVLIGKSDKGQIDVTAALQNSNQMNSDAGNTAAHVDIPGEQFRNMPNGGLVPQENQPATQPPTEQVATTTSETGTSTSSENSSTSTPDTGKNPT
jgi:hypothetical protein